METNPIRVCELLVGLPYVDALGIDDPGGDGPLRVHVNAKSRHTTNGQVNSERRRFWNSRSVALLGVELVVERHIPRPVRTGGRRGGARIRPVLPFHELLQPSQHHLPIPLRVCTRFFGRIVVLRR
ncbi:MAG: hypothetical protein KatS3mg011_2094 [Acidimicrobiia bacterium]|nr:MAG: hypothetical protein KatS3mg011_2094 [Acidimicrobiia bacterium]